MTSYIIRRLALFPVVLLVISFLVFSLQMFLSPRARLAMYITNPSELKGSPERVSLLIEQYGLDDPFWVQYARWLNNLVHGNLGWSQTARMPVLEALLSRSVATLELALFAAFPIVFGGVWLGTKAAIHHNRFVDHFLRVFALAGSSLPAFVFAIFMLMLFYGGVHIFPPGRLSTWAYEVVNSPEFHRYTGINVIDSILNGNWRVLLDTLEHLVLPVLTLSYVNWSSLLRVTRSSMLETLRQDYVMVARAKGLKESVVQRRYARRNALLPVVTLAGMQVAGLLGGVVITETIFNYPGLGRLAVTAAAQLDFPTVLGTTLLGAFVLIFVNLIVDLLYAFLDPRVRYT